MKIADVKANAFAMPLTSPAFPRGPYRFVNREFLVITYRTDMDALARRGARAARSDRAAGEIRIHSHARLHRFRRLHRIGAGYPGELPWRTRRLCACDVSQRSSADSRWPRVVGFSEEAGHADAWKPRSIPWSARSITARCVWPRPRWVSSIAEADHAKILAGLAAPNYLLKIIPHVDGTPRICELVRYYTTQRHPEGRLDRACIAGAASACASAGGGSAGAEGGIGLALRHRSHARSGYGGLRLSCCNRGYA